MRKLLRQALAWTLVLCTIFTLFPIVSAAADSQFADLDTGHWAYGYIRNVVDKGLMVGVSAHSFAPEGSLSRAMLTVILARIAGVTTDNTQSTDFVDVPAGKWYTGAIAWAAENRLTEGIGQGRFAPDSPITREQAATILARYVSFAGLSLAEVNTEITFTDDASISAWARASVKALQTAGILEGMTDGSFQPRASITRAQTAALISRFLDATAKDPQPTEPEPTESEPTEPEPTEPEPTEPKPTEPEPTEPEEITVTFITGHCAVLVQGQTVTEITLEPGRNHVEFSILPETFYELQDVQTSSGVLGGMHLTYTLGQLTEDATVTVTTKPQEHAVTFNPNNGEALTQVKVVHGQTVAKPQDPVKDGDTFLGWFDISGAEFDFSTPILQSMTLNARWLNDSYLGNVVYLNGESGSDALDGMTPETAVRTFARAQAIIPEQSVDGIIYLTGKITITSDEVWDMGGKDCTLLRDPNTTGDHMVAISAGAKLTLSGITIDGNEDTSDTSAVKSFGHLFYVDGIGAELIINDGTTIRNFLTGGSIMNVRQGAKVTMNGGEITCNRTPNMNAILTMYPSSSDPNKSCVFTMNGGEITCNTSGTGCMINLSSGYASICLNGGSIANNTMGGGSHRNYGTIYFGTSKTGSRLTVTGTRIYGNTNADGTDTPALAGGQNENIIFLDPAEGKTCYVDTFLARNAESTNGKKAYLATSTGLKHLDGSVAVELTTLYTNAILLSGADGYVLTEEDLSKVTLVNDITDMYRIVLDKELNQIILSPLPTNDITVYLDGTKGKDTNDGLTVRTGVKTLERAKEILKAQIAAREDIPADANFVISVTGAVTIDTDTTITMADFGANADRVLIRRDSSYSSGYLFTFTRCDVTLENVTFDGNRKFIQKNNKAVFALREGANVVVNDGTIVQNFFNTSTSGLFMLVPGKVRGDVTLTFNSGVIRNCEGGTGTLVSLIRASGSATYKSVCTVNEILVEDCVCNGVGMFYAMADNATSMLIFNGGTFRNNTASTGGSVAAISSSANAEIYINPSDSLHLEGDIYLTNHETQSGGGFTLLTDRVVKLGGPLLESLNITCSRPVAGTPVVEGNSYTLTEADLSLIRMTTDDVLILDAGLNRILITKVM